MNGKLMDGKLTNGKLMYRKLVFLYLQCICVGNDVLCVIRGLFTHVVGVVGINVVVCDTSLCDILGGMERCIR